MNEPELFKKKQVMMQIKTLKNKQKNMTLKTY